MKGSDIQKFCFYDKYSRWLWGENRYETFEEAVDRTIEHAKYLAAGKLNDTVFEELRDGMLSLDAFPAMRLFQTAGEEAKRHPEAMFNCSYLNIDCVESFVETMFLLGVGVGVGYSVEFCHVSKLPIVEYWSPMVIKIAVEDSIEGWAKAFRVFLECMFNGLEVDVDYSLIRPTGAPLKTRGGVASGAAPLKAALEKISEIFESARGRQLTTLEAHDIQCYVASAIVCGGYRGSAMIALFDDSDKAMFECKSLQNIAGNEQRYYANNSVVLEEFKSPDWYHQNFRPTLEQQTGEPGIISRYAIKKNLPERRQYRKDFGVNPCAEIVLRPNQFCNLTIANVRSHDTIETLRKKVRLATIWGTLISSVNEFPNIRGIWSKNQVDERLLGVDLNGQRDSDLFNNPETRNNVLEIMRATAKKVNIEYAAILGITPSTAITTAKPAGNSSVLFDTSSGISPRYAPYYIRRVQVNTNSSMGSFLFVQGVPWSSYDGVEWGQTNTAVFDFYVAAPKSAVFIENVSAVDQLDYWRDVRVYYTEHNPSITINYDQNEIDDIVFWMYTNQHLASGISFFPRTNVVYRNAPYESISEQTYNAVMLNYPIISWDNFGLYASLDPRIGSEFACVGGACDIA
jgi:ribonucleoside-triphosphate reductase